MNKALENKYLSQDLIDGFAIKPKGHNSEGIGHSTNEEPTELVFLWKTICKPSFAGEGIEDLSLCVNAKADS